MSLKEELSQLIITKAAQQNISSEKDLFNIERKINEKYHQFFIPFYELLNTYKELVKQKLILPNKQLEKILTKSRIRSLSGIVSITTITKPYPCPGNCLYCPSVPNMPKSYLPDEPACMRALLNQFDPYKQMQVRIKTLQINGHPTDKIELIVLGGTWSYYPKRYQTWFIKRCFDGANNSTSPNLQISQKINESAHNRIIGLTLETRPDYISSKEIEGMRILGATRVELGVQSTYDDVLQSNNRGNTVNDIIMATGLLKNAGFKITYHMMLNLPGSDIKKDEQMFEELFSNPYFQPDQLKIYPCAVLKEAPLYELYLNKKYQPYSNEELVNLLIKIKEKIPPYVRIIRIIRDIPSQSIVAGNKVSNLREVVAKKMNSTSPRLVRLGRKNCRCIRCREIGNLKFEIRNLKLVRRDYKASNGTEIFLSFEDIKNDKILAFLRLRLANSWTLPILKNSALIRELHTYGQVAALSQKSKVKSQKFVQHKSLGKKLMTEAEKIAKQEFGFKKLAVISGIGVRDYYRKLGYKLKDEYMIKSLT